MLIQRTDVTFNRSGLSALPNVFPYPQQLGSALKAWFTANAGITQASNIVSAWADQSGNGITLTSVGASPIDYVPADQNGLPGVVTSLTTNSGTAVLSTASFSGTTAQNSVDFDMTTSFSVSLALKAGAFTSGTSTDQLLIGTGIAATGWYIESRSSTVSAGLAFILEPPGGTALKIGYPQPASGTTYHLTVTYDGSNAIAGLKMYLNGVLVTPAATVGTTGAGTLLQSAARYFSIFTKPASAYNDPTTVFEAVIVNTALSSAQVTLMDTYLNSKWALHA